MAARSFRPRLGLPTTVIAEDDTVYLVAGEDVRYTLRAGGQSALLAELLRRCDGKSELTDLLRDCPLPDQERLEQFIRRLAGERILVDGEIQDAVVSTVYSPCVEGTGPLVDRFSRAPSTDETIQILCQDDLNYDAAHKFNRQCLRAGDRPWMWITTGPASRGYVSPVFLPNTGPCLSCLLRQFQRLSPLPQLYDALVHHGDRGGTFAPVKFPPHALVVLEQLAQFKINQLQLSPPPPAVFRLHVLELGTMEVQVHRVFSDPTCPECADARLV